jgi:cytochrome c peroxidase
VIRILLLALAVSCSSSKTERKQAAASVASDAGAHPRSDHPVTVTLAPAPPLPEVPAGLPPLPPLPGVTPEAVALGELLFWDPRLSSTGALACASCHDPSAGYAGASRQNTASGKPNVRRAAPLVNLAWVTQFGWDGRFSSIEDQLTSHIRGQLGHDLATSVPRLASLPQYQAQLARVGGDTTNAALTALAAYVQTRYAGDSRWDRVERSSPAAAPSKETATLRAGYQLFTGKAQCSVCHTPPLYTDLQFHRLGLIAIKDEGRARIEPAKAGAFRTPTLRGAALRKGFFHDASAPTLDAAIDWHLEGGTGHGADPSIIDIKPIALAPIERTQLGAFVAALTAASPLPTKPVLP